MSGELVSRDRVQRVTDHPAGDGIPHRLGPPAKGGVALDAPPFTLLQVLERAQRLDRSRGKSSHAAIVTPAFLLVQRVTGGSRAPSSTEPGRASRARRPPDPGSSARQGAVQRVGGRRPPVVDRQVPAHDGLGHAKRAPITEMTDYLPWLDSVADGLGLRP